jgi:hypothetical protein
VLAWAESTFGCAAVRRSCPAGQSVIAESLTQVCAMVIGNDTTIVLARPER